MRLRRTFVSSACLRLLAFLKIFHPLSDLSEAVLEARTMSYFLPLGQEAYL